MKVAIIGAGNRAGQPGFFLMEELRHKGIEVDAEPMQERVAVIPTRRPEYTVRTRNTGAARIKRNAKQRRRRKG